MPNHSQEIKPRKGKTSKVIGGSVMDPCRIVVLNEMSQHQLWKKTASQIKEKKLLQTLNISNLRHSR